MTATARLTIADTIPKSFLAAVKARGEQAAIREKHTRGLPPNDAQIVDFTHQLLRKHRADEQTVKALRRRFGDDGFIQLTGAIGYYSMLAMTVNACELEAAAGAEVLTP